LRVCDESVPGVTAGIEDGLVSVVDPVAELISPEELPDVFDRVEFGAVGRQLEQADVVGQAQPAAALVPAGAVEDEDGVCAGSDLGADLGEVGVHLRAEKPPPDFGTDAGQHQCGTGGASRAHRAKQIGRAVALIAGRPGPAALFGPDIAGVPLGSQKSPACGEGGRKRANDYWPKRVEITREIAEAGDQ
jgi:hypothetical protein